MRCAMRAPRRTGPAILASGGIVVAAMLVLGLADFNATREMGPILALGIAVMVAAGLTLLPALLAALGRRAFWPAPRPSVARCGRAIGALVRRAPSRRRPPCSRCSSPARSATSQGRGYLDLTRAVPRPAGVRPRAAS